MTQYLRFVSAVQPDIVLLENVRGFTMDFKDAALTTGKINYSAKLQDRLARDYWVFSRTLDCSTFGVPQQRRRFFIVAMKRTKWPSCPSNPFDNIEAARLSFLRNKGIAPKTSASAAISDFEIKSNGTSESADSKGFKQIKYKRPATAYQRLMHSGLNTAPTDLRVARHRPDIVARFTKIIKACHQDGRLGVVIDRSLLRRFGMKKQAFRVLDPSAPAPTITSMPDDLLHYHEPRTLTVRENARLQSFPDWFAFKGKYTTGGDKRRFEVPRFTQVANAVPPLVAEAIGLTLKQLIIERDQRSLLLQKGRQRVKILAMIK